MDERSEWQSVEEMEKFKALESLLDEVWDEVSTWKDFAKTTVGTQLVRASDSVGANVIEGDSRYHFKDKLNSCYIARGSASETRFWLRRAKARGIIDGDRADLLIKRFESVRHWMNSLIRERRSWLAGQVKKTALSISLSR